MTVNNTCNNWALFTRFQFLHDIWKFYTKFGDLLLRKMNEFVATRCQIRTLCGHSAIAMCVWIWSCGWCLLGTYVEGVKKFLTHGGGVPKCVICDGGSIFYEKFSLIMTLWTRNFHQLQRADHTSTKVWAPVTTKFGGRTPSFSQTSRSVSPSTRLYKRSSSSTVALHGSSETQLLSVVVSKSQDRPCLSLNNSQHLRV